MDIRKFAVSETTRIQINDPQGDAIPGAFVTVYGPGSRQHAQAQTNQQNKLMARLKKKAGDITVDQKISNDADYLADCTESMEGIELDKLQGRELHMAVYSDRTLGFIADQVAACIGDWANFTKGSKAS